MQDENILVKLIDEISKIEKYCPYGILYLQALAKSPFPLTKFAYLLKAPNRKNIRNANYVPIINDT